MKLLLETLSYKYDTPTDTYTAIVGIVVPDEYMHSIHLEFMLHHRAIDDKWRFHETSRFTEYNGFNEPAIVEVTQDRDNVKIQAKAYTWMLFPIGNLLVCTEISNNGQVEACEIVTLGVSTLECKQTTKEVFELEFDKDVPTGYRWKNMGVIKPHEGDYYFYAQTGKWVYASSDRKGYYPTMRLVKDLKTS